jgi:hypothetical protein
MNLYSAKLHARRCIILQLAGYFARVTGNTFLRIKNNEWFHIPRSRAEGALECGSLLQPLGHALKGGSKEAVSKLESSPGGAADNSRG